MAGGDTFERNLSNAFSAAEDFFLAMYLSMRVYISTSGAFGPETPFLRGLILLALGFVVLRRGLTWRKDVDDGGLLFPAVLYLVVIVAAAINSFHPSVSWAQVRFFCEIVLFVVVLGDTPEGETHRRERVLATLLAAAAVVFVHAFHQKLWGLADLAERVARQEIDTGTTFDSPWAKARLYAGQPYGAFLTCNVLGGYIVMLLPVVAGIGLRQWRLARRGTAAIWNTWTCAGILLVLWTGSRGALAGLLVSALLFAYFHLRGTRRRSAFWMLWAAAGCAAVILAVSMPAWSSMGIRAGYWLGGLRAWFAHPMGIGPGAFDIVYSQFRPVWGMETRVIHNIYLDALVSGGPVLLIAFAFLFYRLWKCGAQQNTGASAGQALDTELCQGQVQQPAPASETPERPIIPLLHYLAMAVAVLAAGVVFGGLTYEGVVLIADYGDTSTAAYTGAAAFILMVVLAPLTTWFAMRTLDDFAKAPPVTGIEKEHHGPGFLRNGFVAGLLGFMVHGWVDVLWPAEGVAVTLIALAWAVAPRCRHTEAIRLWRAEAPMFTPSRVALVVFGGLALGAALVYGCLLPLSGALAYRRITFALEPRIKGIAEDLAALKRASEQARMLKGKDAAETVRTHEFSPGLLLGAPDGVTAEKNTLLEALARNDTRPLREIIARTEVVIGEYERDLDDAAARFLDKFPDDRAYFELSLIRRSLALAGANPMRENMEAERLSVEALSHAPQAGAYWTHAGELALDRGDYLLAAQRLATARNLYPTSPIRWVALGDVALLGGASVHAAKYYQKAMELNAETVEEQASLYSISVHPGLLRRRSLPVANDFNAALAAAMHVAGRSGGSVLRPEPFMFRAALEELARGDPAEAAATFRILSGAYSRDFEDSFLLLEWAALNKGKRFSPRLADIEAAIRSPATKYMLHRLKLAFSMNVPRL